MDPRLIFQLRLFILDVARKVVVSNYVIPRVQAPRTEAGLSKMLKYHAELELINHDLCYQLQKSKSRQLDLELKLTLLKSIIQEHIQHF